jgi:hypothetical protein
VEYIKSLFKKLFDILGFNDDETVGCYIITGLLILWLLFAGVILSLVIEYELDWALNAFLVLVFGVLFIYCRKYVLITIAYLAGGFAWFAGSIFVYMNWSEHVGLIFGAIPYCYTAWKMFLGRVVNSAIKRLKLLSKYFMV